MTQSDYENQEEYKKYLHLINTKLSFNREEYGFLLKWDKEFVENNLLQFPIDDIEGWLNLRVNFKNNQDD